jgi:FtsH-binding integral membrane protein
MAGKKSRPNKVFNAVTLLWITIAVGVIRSILEFSNLAQMASPSFIIFVQIFTLAILAFFIYMIGKGRNWARITFLVLFITGIPFSILPMIQSFAVSPISGILGIGQTTLQIIALVFLFQKPSSDWFKSMKK